MVSVNGFEEFDGAPELRADDPYRVDPGASAWQTEPWAELTSRLIWKGELPLWNPYQAAGKPHAANFQSAVADPLLLAVNLHPTPWVWDLSFLAAFGLGSGFMFLFLRGRTLGRGPALLGVAVFSLSGYFALYSNNLFVRSYIYLPVLFWMADRLIASPSRARICIFGLGISGSILVGMPESTFFIGLALVMYALYRIVVDVAKGLRWRTLYSFAIAGGLGVLIASPLLALFIEYEGLSHNIHKATNQAGLQADSYRLLPLWVTPFLNGKPLGSIVPSLAPTRNWVGAGAIALVVVSFAAPRRFLRERAALAFAGIAAIFIWRMYGMTGYESVGRLPVFELALTPTFSSPVIAFCLAALAAIGLDAIMRSALSRVRLGAGIAILLLLATLALGWYEPVLLASNGLRVLRSIGLAFCAVLIVILAAYSARRLPLAAAVVAAGMVLVELTILFPRSNLSQRADPYRSPSWLPIMLSDRSAQVDNVDTGGTRPVARVFGLEAKLFPETATTLGLQDIRTLDALYVGRYFRFVKAFIEPQIATRFVGGNYPSEEGPTPPHVENNPMFDLLGVKYVLTGPATGPASLVDEVFGRRPETETIKRESFVLGGRALPTLFTASGESVEIPVPITETEQRFSFSYGLDARTFSLASPSDGVRFAVEYAVPGQAPLRLWDAAYVPGIDPVRPEWRSASVALPESSSPSGVLRLVVDPLATGANDWAGWAEMSFDRPGKQTGPQFRLLGASESGQTRVFENRHALPRAFIVRDLHSVADEDAAIARMSRGGAPFVNGGVKVGGFDPRREAVVEAKAEELPKVGTCDGSADKVNFESYGASEVVLKVQAACAGMLLLTDTYYPGWQASVNGHATAVHPADVAFRGVAVPAGESRVVFKYRPKNFRAAMSVSMLTALGIAVVLLLEIRGKFVVWRARRKPAATALSAGAVLEESGA